MIRQAGSLGILVVATAIVGAGNGSPYEKALTDMIGSLDTIGMTLKTIIDEDSAVAAKKPLRGAAKIWIDARARAAKLQPPERTEKTRLEKLYKPKLEESLKKMFTEIRRVENIPGGKDALKEIAGVLKKDEK